MALPSTLYRFDIDLSDVDRGVYAPHTLRLAQHPSETLDFLLTRLLAYLLEWEDGLEFGPGLCVSEAPALSRVEPGGRTRLWIDVGNPSPERIHKASKASDRVLIYTYKDPTLLRRSVEGQRVHRAADIEVVALERAFLDALAARLQRQNAWTVVRTEGVVYVTAGDATVEGRPERAPLA
jgi:uncharacterized protein YaeQ